MSNLKWNGWWSSIGSPFPHHCKLFFVHILEPCDSHMVCNPLQIVFAAVEKRDTDVRLFQSADVVGSVAAHEGVKAGFFETIEDVLFLGGGDAGVDPDVGKEGGDEWFVVFRVEFREGRAGETDVVFVEEGLVERVTDCV